VRHDVVLALVQRALEHAGLDETVGMALHLDTQSPIAGAEAYPEGSAQLEALWGLIMRPRSTCIAFRSRWSARRSAWRSCT
jgi:hypothetical protein